MISTWKTGNLDYALNRPTRKSLRWLQDQDLPAARRAYIIRGMIAARSPLPRFRALAQGLPLENAVRIEMEEGLPVLRATEHVQERIAELLAKQQDVSLSLEEEHELDRFEEMDDYLSLLNRLARNRAA